MTITVYGLPAPQGSKRAFVLKGTNRAVMVESSKNVKPWRAAVQAEVLALFPMKERADPILCHGAVFLDVTFTMPRPKSAKRDARPSTRPDLDKLLRSTKDALKTAGVYEDDGRVVSLIAAKVYPCSHGNDACDCGDALPVPGALIRVERV